MKGPQIDDFAQTHGLKRISVADLIAHRQAREKLVERLGTFPVKTEFGEFTGYAYATPFDEVQHFAFVHGRIGDGRNILVRLHRANVVADIFEGGKTVHGALRRFAREGRGVLVYLRDGTAGVPLTRFARTSPRAPKPCGSKQWREVGLGAQICAISASPRSATFAPPRAPMSASRVRDRDRRRGADRGRALDPETGEPVL
jgi:3,4-dihydroxy 2-butanone 4-phosphate synthase/GTP cyclohydrolase II